MTERERPDQRYPEIRLEMPDYWDEGDVLENMVETLRQHGVEPDHLLFCGYDAAQREDEPRDRLFAYTIQEYREQLEYPTTDVNGTPLEYALEGEEPTIGVYDRQHFTMPHNENPMIWEAVDGSVSNGQVAQFNIKPVS